MSRDRNAREQGGTTEGDPEASGEEGLEGAPPRPIEPDDQEERIDEALDESFPASDPPAFVAGDARSRSPTEEATREEGRDESERGTNPGPSPASTPPRGRKVAGDGRRGPKMRHRADLVVIIASVWALVSAFRIPPDVMTEEGDVVAESVPLLAGAYGLGGLLGFGGLIVAQKWPSPGRFMIGGGGLVILAGFLALQEVTIVSVLSLGIPGLGLLLAAPFAGSMPRSVRER